MIFNSEDSYFYSSKVNQKNVYSGFGTKSFNTDQLNEETIVNLCQIHKDAIATATDTHQIPDCDGVITSKKNLTLLVKTADCVPIIYADPVAGIVGISHQGWKGTLLRLPQKMIDKFVEIGSRTKEICVAIGPSIGLCCYNIPLDRSKLFIQEFGEEYIDKRGDKLFLNLLKSNFDMLQKSGIISANIDIFPFCTNCDDRRFFSYRRGDAGRMINWVGLKK